MLEKLTGPSSPRQPPAASAEGKVTSVHIQRYRQEGDTLTNTAPGPTEDLGSSGVVGRLLAQLQ